MTRVLLVEDEERLVASLKDGLRTAQIEVVDTRTGREGLALARSQDFDLMILDIGLPDQEGFTVLRKLRASGSDLPVLILTARTSAEDTVRGLKSGADDYMPKPFSFDELLARIRLRSRKPLTEDPTTTVIEVGHCVLDPLNRTLEVDGEPVSLSNREFQLAHLLMSQAGRVVTRAEALEHVWGSAARANVLDVYIRYLRSRMGTHAIKTVRGEGYLFVG
ncbi:MAG: response regulator transcription factor [Demequinaceae bacterium]|nr:response regulator transcription factor [Demequinaceae bacterium]